jgi:hypothetical protein
MATNRLSASRRIKARSSAMRRRRLCDWLMARQMVVRDSL